MKKNQIDFITLGCSKNLVDSEILMKQFEANGYKCTHDSKNPQGEIAVINTCGFIGDAKEESINTILEFADAKADLLELADTVNGITPDAITDLASESDILAEILAEDGMNAEFLASIMQSMADGGAGLSMVTAEALKLNDALDGMVDMFDQVTDAKSRYDSAMSVDEKDTDFRSYVEAFEELNAQFEAGTTNSNAFWAAAEKMDQGTTVPVG